MSQEQKSKRYACTSDLANYFKKKDLLGGLTELEKDQLRRNIGIVDFNDPQDITKIARITHAQLNDLIITNLLLPGKRYLISDFQTIYSSNVLINNIPITWGNDESENPSPILEIIVSAVSNNRIDPRIVINDISTKNWYIEYDPSKEILPDGKITKGRVTYLKDDNNNSAYYDFKNIKFRRTNKELSNSNFIIRSEYIDFFTFSDYSSGSVKDSSSFFNTKNNNIKTGSFNNVFMGDTYNNIIEEDCVNNTFLRGCHDSVFKWNSVNNFFNENVCYTSGSIYNKINKIGNTDFAMTINKTIHKVNDSTILSFLDPITYSYQVIIL